MTRFTRTRGLLAVFMLVASLAFVACGGDDKKSESKSDTTAAEKAPATTEKAPATTEEAAPEEAAPASDFAAEANSYCEEAAPELQALAEAGEVGELVSLSSQLTEEIAALEPPAGQEETFNQLIELARANDVESMRIVEDGGTVEDLAAQDSSEADALATELGMTSCVS
jgi:hypothetical protein